MNEFKLLVQSGVYEPNQEMIVKSIEKSILQSDNIKLQHRILSCLETATSIIFNCPEVRKETFYDSCKMIVKLKGYSPIKYLINFMDFHGYHKRAF